jgi:hypothetical protein
MSPPRHAVAAWDEHLGSRKDGREIRDVAHRQAVKIRSPKPADTPMRTVRAYWSDEDEFRDELGADVDVLWIIAHGYPTTHPDVLYSSGGQHSLAVPLRDLIGAAEIQAQHVVALVCDQDDRARSHWDRVLPAGTELHLYDSEVRNTAIRRIFTHLHHLDDTAHLGAYLRTHGTGAGTWSVEPVPS